MRAFIAIDITDRIRAELASLQCRLKETLHGEIIWVRPENIHVTLRFLGGIAAEEVEKIKKVVTDIAAAGRSFIMELGALNAFPTLYNPRIIWVGISMGFDEIEFLNAQLEEKLSALGLPPDERDFYPHLTLARVKTLSDKDQFEKASRGIKPSHTASIADNIALFKSTLTPRGPRYEKIFSVNLPSF